MSKATQMSCGGCGHDSWRVTAEGGGPTTLSRITLICLGCGSVSHLVPRATIAIEWGRQDRGEKDLGVLAHIPWGSHPQKTEATQANRSFWAMREQGAPVGAAAAAELRNMATMVGADEIGPEDLQEIRSRMVSLADLLGNRQ